MTLQDLLDLYAAGDMDAVRAALADGSVDPAELEAAAQAAFADLRTTTETATGADADAALDALEVIAGAVVELRTESARRAEVAAERATRVAEIASRITPAEPAAEPADETAAQAGQADAEGQADGGEGTTAEPAGASGGEPAAAESAAEVPALAAAAQPPAQPPAPSAAPSAVPAVQPRPRVNLAGLRGSRPPATPPNTAAVGAALVAAANVPGVEAGAEIDMDTLATAAINRFGALPRHDSRHDGRVQLSIGHIRKPARPDLVADGNNDDEVLAHAADERRLPGGSLVAAGDWCAPSETWYDIACERETTAGLISLPEVTASRGGIRWTQGPDFAALFTHSGFFVQTEAQADAGDEKPCFEIPCTDFDECRLDAIGLCLSAGILTNRAYPELIARYIRGSLTAHAHRYAGETIARMVAGSTAVALPPAAYSAAIDVLGALDLQATDYRYRHRMDPGATLEVIAPYWLLGVLRSDYAHRNAIDSPYSVTNAMITSWFAARNISVQFVYNWQDGFSTPAGTIGGAVPPTAWPASVQVLMYAAGTWVRATQDIITLDAVYDSTLFRINRYNAIFSEEGLCVIQRCPDSRVLTIPICATGRSGEQLAVTCPSV